ncbi:class I adenylate-forming enzyme family protein [Hydrogenimonas sp.]
MTQSRRWLGHFRKFSDDTAIIDDNRTFTYEQLFDAVERYERKLREADIKPGDVVAIHSDYSFDAIALFFALAEHGNIVVPIIALTADEVTKRLRISTADWVFEKSAGGLVARKCKNVPLKHPLIERLKHRNHAGLILFSSGSTGEPKAMLHDLDRLMESYEGKNPKRLTTLLFLTFDHIGGIDTMLRTLAIGGTLAIPASRQPESVCETIETFRVNVLPVSPTFINLLLLSGLDTRYDLGSLEIIAFGAEPMPEPLLRRIKERFPNVRLQQKFGTSETSAVRIKSEADGSLFFRIDDPNVEYRIVDGELWLKSGTQVLGYLNAPMESFTQEGWFKTGDLVQQTPEGLIKIVGRSKEIINVGGEKVFPSEVEAVLLEMPEIADVMVYGEENAITGQGVTADIVPDGDFDKREMKKRVRRFCKGRLDGYKIPSRVNVVDKTNFTERFKKIRRK